MFILRGNSNDPTLRHDLVTIEVNESIEEDTNFVLNVFKEEVLGEIQVSVDEEDANVIGVQEIDDSIDDG